MKQMHVRILCGFLLLIMAMGIMAGVILAMPEEEALFAWSRITFQTGGKQVLSLYDGEGQLLRMMQTDGEGRCMTELLEEGSYYGVCRDGLVRFDLTAQGIQGVEGTAEVTEDFCLSFCPSQHSGEVRITGKARQEWYEYELRSATYSCKKILRCTEGDPILCTIQNIPYGDYTLLENGRTLCRVEVTEEEPLVELSLP